MRRCKHLGVTLFCLLVLGGAAVSSASAATTIQAGSYGAEISGAQEEATVLMVEGVTVSCSTTTLTGEIEEPMEGVAGLAPAFSSSCTSSGSAATVSPEGCTLSFQVATKTFDIACPTGKAIKVTTMSGQCEFQIGSQTGLAAEYTNVESSPKTVRAKLAGKSVKYTKTKDELFCPFVGTGEKTDGTLSGKLLLKAVAGAQVELFLAEALLAQLCSVEKENPCTKSPYAIPSTVEATLIGTTEIKLLIGGKNSNLGCTGSTLKGTTARGSKAAGLDLTNVTWTFTGCGCTVTMTASPKNWFWPGAGGSGSLEMVADNNGASAVMVVDCLDGNVCKYGRNSILGPITAGKPAKMEYAAVPMSLIETVKGTCFGGATLTAKYEFTAPKTALGVAQMWVTT
jgi:hypothetical protein